jgi:lycopene cyclase domain-containing protein
MSLYLIIELASLSVPFILSFDKKVAFYKHWKFLFPAISISALFFISVDIWFTEMGVWGFNPEYHSAIMFAGLPLEEILFFIIIPYCSIFIHYVIIEYFPETYLKYKSTLYISFLLIFILLVITLFNLNKTYTAFYSAFSVVIIILTLWFRPAILSRFYLSFLVILVPFFIVNGILTGSFIEDEVVWYNANEINGFRIFTVPAEDLFYGFSMILLSLLIMNIFRKYPEKA